MTPVDKYRVKPGSKIKLSKTSACEDGGMSKEKGRAALEKLTDKLQQLQELMYAQGKHSLLVVLQAMDAGGKDSTIRNVFGPLNPQGCRVTGFKQPNKVERGHDFLWRIHQHTPRVGNISVFNRSHYEDVLVVRVKKLAPPKVWRGRYDHINNFEKMLNDEGTAVVKFYLHITKDYQKKRIQRRLDRPDKHWKFTQADVTERKYWGSYQKAFEDALEKCSTPHAPWYVIPAEHHWYRNLVIAQVLVNKLQSLKMKYPKPQIDLENVVLE